MAVLARDLEVEWLADIDILVMPRKSISEAVAERLDAIGPHAGLLDRRHRTFRGVEQPALSKQRADLGARIGPDIVQRDPRHRLMAIFPISGGGGQRHDERGDAQDEGSNRHGLSLARRACFAS